MKETIQEAEKSLAGAALPKMTRTDLHCTKQRLFEQLSEEGFKGKEMAGDSQEVQNIFKVEAKELSLAKVQEKEILQNLEKAQVKDRSYGLSL